MRNQKVTNRWKILTICSLALVIITMDTSIVSIALPEIQKGLGGSISTLQWVTDAYVLTLGGFLLLAGATADRVGRKKIFSLGLFGFGIGSMLCGFAWNPISLIIFRAIQGFAASALTTVAMSIITNVFTDSRERAQAIGIYGACSGVSLGLAAPIGGFLLRFFNWSSIFFVNVPIVLLALILTHIYIPESRDNEELSKYDTIGQVLMILSLISLIFTLIELPGWGLLSVNTFLAIVIIAILSSLFIYRELHFNHPVIKLEYFKSIPLSCAAVLTILGYSIFNGFLFINSIFLQDVLGFTPLKAGVISLPLAVVAFIVSPISGHIVGKLGTMIPLLLCGSGMLVSSILSLFAVQFTHLLIMFFVYCALGIGFGFLNAPTMTIATSSLPLSKSGTSAGIVNSCKQIGNALGVALLGIISNLGMLNPQKTSHLLLRQSMLPAYKLFIVFSILIIFLTFISNRASSK